MYLVICTVMVIITVLILKDTHVTVYYNGYSRSVALIEEDYDLKVPVWNPDKLSGYTHKFNLREIIF